MELMSVSGSCHTVELVSAFSCCYTVELMSYVRLLIYCGPVSCIHLPRIWNSAAATLRIWCSVSGCRYMYTVELMSCVQLLPSCAAGILYPAAAILWSWCPVSSWYHLLKLLSCNQLLYCRAEVSRLLAAILWSWYPVSGCCYTVELMFCVHLLPSCEAGVLYPAAAIL